MSNKTCNNDSGIPASLRGVGRRFDLWRKSHQGRVPIPERLWASAAQAAREHGVFRTAKVLRLEYGKLKRMAEGAPPRTKPTVRLAGARLTRPKSTAPSAFVELMAAGARLPEYTIELEGRNGKLRIHCKGATVADLEGLGRALWDISS